MLPYLQTGIEGKGMPPLEALNKAFMDVNSDLRHSGVDDGSTGTVVFINGTDLYAANAGDSPCFMLMESGEVRTVTEEHSPNSNPAETARVRAAGGRVEKMSWGDHGQRVLSADSFSGLAMTRAFGDFKFPGVIVDPYLSQHDISGARYVVIASDGLTEAWTVEGAGQYLAAEAAQGHSVAVLAEKLAHRALMQGSRDNITVLVISVSQYLENRAAAAAAVQRPGATGLAVGHAKASAQDTGAAAAKDEDAEEDVDVRARDQGLPRDQQARAHASPSADSPDEMEMHSPSTSDPAPGPELVDSVAWLPEPMPAAGTHLRRPQSPQANLSHSALLAPMIGMPLEVEATASF